MACLVYVMTGGVIHLIESVHENEHFKLLWGFTLITDYRLPIWHIRDRLCD